jgi:Site-specific recombinase XerD
MNNLLNDYLRSLRIEQGLADNSIMSYRRDLQQFCQWLTTKGLDQFPEDPSQLSLYLQFLAVQGKAQSSRMRAVSSLRHFYRWLSQREIIQHNPMETIPSPKRGQHLPVALTVNEVDQLLAAPNTATKLGLRDRAILEVMYATGLRVSELVHLQLSDLHLELGLINTIGKGNKERLIPIGDVAIKYVKRYLNNSRPQLLKSDHFVGYAFF